MTDTVPAGSTNDDAPFQPGETVVFCDETATVLENFGRYGTVNVGPNENCRWYWRFEGEDVRRVLPLPSSAALALRRSSEMEKETRTEMVARMLVEMTPADRMLTLELAAESFCLACGENQPLHGTCPCWNDD